MKNTQIFATSRSLKLVAVASGVPLERSFVAIASQTLALMPVPQTTTLYCSQPAPTVPGVTAPQPLASRLFPAP